MHEELEHLRSMWTPPVRRSRNLFVPIKDDGTGIILNQHWAFEVPFAFREALDIRYEQQQVDKQAVWMWTQGPFISFRLGDSFASRDGKRYLQVELASPMNWNSVSEEMNLGAIVAAEYRVAGGKYSKHRSIQCSQMDFLELLISGKLPKS